MNVGINKVAGCDHRRRRLGGGLTSGLNANNTAQAALPVPLSLGKDPSPHGFADRMDTVQQDACYDLGEVRASRTLLPWNNDIGGGRRGARGRDRTQRDKRSRFGAESTGGRARRARGRVPLNLNWLRRWDVDRVRGASSPNFWLRYVFVQGR